MQEWPEEEIALGLEEWPTLMIAKLVAIWAAILMIPKEKQVEIHTDSNAAIRNIGRSLEQTDRNKIIKKKNAIWIMKIKDLVKTKNIQIDLVKVKSHSKDKWNDRADSLAKKGTMSREIVQVEKVSCKEIEYCLEWENRRTDIPARLLCKLVTNAKLGAEWKETRAIKSLEPEAEITIFDWTYFWKRLKTTKGIHCTTRRSSSRRSAFIKCIIDKLPTLEELNRRRPDIYTTVECQVCQDKVKETQAHLAACKGQRNLWKRIQKVTIATAWKKLKEEEKIQIPLYVLYTALFGKTETEEVKIREALIKGLIPKETQDKLAELLNTRSRQQFANTVAITAWDTFYEQVWRIRCEKIIEWEEKIGITGRIKRKKGGNLKESKKQGKTDQKRKEEKKEEIREKGKQIEKEVTKTMLGLVMKGRRPFHYGL
jgi:ribonuclease HI